MSAPTTTSLTFTQSSPLPAKETSDRSQPSESEPLSLSMTFFTTKDQRAYEHDRHRNKQKQSRELSLGRKTFGSVGSVGSGRRWLPMPSFTAVGLSGWKDKSAGKTASGTDDVTSETGEDWVETHGEVVREREQGAFAGREAKLADLVVSVRKPGKVKGRDLDFEFIPHVRSVIVLDDIIQTKDVPATVDEPWECVGGEEEKKETYANVVANARI
ncbi:hypothetical protein AAF712_003396 [Marasmius tenuissimus]|uniref:Uncharacterized protein n=1 Tax=Marasmius tenuissimus TaxID=585030 RepID=A0ABR3A7U1_9AGAR